MSSIKPLSPQLISKIAAGEVIERPSSVIKELLENALDAGAEDIKIEVQGGGKQLIRVTDDGEGMDPEDALLALERHTTSKIEREEDLFQIHTFGFRGEALSSISAVSKMKLVTRKDGPLTGVSLEVEGGTVKNRMEVGCPLGTMVEVRDLFFNIPARLKFLKSQRTEVGQVGEVTARIALANPRTRFQLFHDGKLLAGYPVREDPSSRLAEALGREAGKRMHPFHLQSKEIEAEGFAGEPEFNRPNTRGIYLFVNARPVRDRLLSHAVLEAYRNLIPKDRYPVVLLFVKVPPAAVDVNVHPSKWEIRFADSEAIYRTVVRSIRELLERAPWLPQSGDGLRPEIREYSPAYHWSREDQPARTDGQETLGLPTSLPSDAFPIKHTFFGQIDNTYLLFGSPDGLILVDQHAAHERILFEKVSHEFASGSIRRQHLLFPESIELPLLEAKMLEERLADLEKIGFELEPSGIRTFWIRSVPQLLSEGQPLEVLKEMVQYLSSWGKGADLGHSLEPLLQIMACRGAIQASQVLRQEQAVALLTELEGCLSPSNCPHGRPTIRTLTLPELARMFGRK